MMKFAPVSQKLNLPRPLALTLMAATVTGIVGCATGPGFGVEQRGQTAKPPVKTAPGNTSNTATPTQNQVQMLDEVSALKRELQRLQALVEEQQLRLDESERRNSEYYQQLQSQLDSQRARVAQTVPAQPVTNGQLSNNQQNTPTNTQLGTQANDQLNDQLNNQSVIQSGQGTINNSVLTGNNTQAPQTNTSISTGNAGAGTAVRRTDQIINSAKNEVTTQANEGESVIIGTTAGSIGDATQNQAGTVGTANDAAAAGNTGAAEDNNLRVVTIPAANPEQPTTSVGRTLTRESNGAGAIEQVPATQQAQRSYDAALELLKQSKFNEAIVAFEDMLALHGNSDLADDATFWVSEARYVSRDFAPALAGYQTVLQSFPSSERVPESLLKVGVIQAEMGAVEEARQTYQQVMQRFPGSRVAVSAQGRLDKISN